MFGCVLVWFDWVWVLSGVFRWVLECFWFGLSRFGLA